MAKFYITTSIPYVNAPPHIGFALEAVQTDVIARWNRLKGEDVFFLTGTDEHGAKISKAAKEVGLSPEEFTDTISEKFHELGKTLNISNNDFIRTSDQERHWPSVAAVWCKLKENGDLYKKQYDGLYCVGCEAFITQKDLQDGLCAIHKKQPEVVQEENWFFRLSVYGDRVKKAIEGDELRIVPESRKNEIPKFIEQGLEDVSFSRPRKDLQWGIPVPDDDTQTVYVWADALVNYISALRYPDGENFRKYWPADLHLVGKDILRFHATIWPAMLLSLGLELPKAIFVHGFINVAGQKMSKSLGNVVDPFPLIEKYGADALRYFLLREIPPTEDGDFTQEKFQERYNADLASGLGNLVARVLTLATKTNPKSPPSPRLRRAGEIRNPKQLSSPKFETLLEQTRVDASTALDNFQFSQALEKIWGVIHFCDRYIEQEKPWSFDPAQGKEKQKEVLSNLLFVVGEIAELLAPFLPETSEKILTQLKNGKSEILFPRIGTPS